MRTLIRSSLLLSALLGTACASSSTGSADRNRITAEEISTATGQNAYEVIRRLQPQWLESRGATGLNQAPSSVSTATVYVDGGRRGDLEYLRTIPLHTIAEIRYWLPREASERFGVSLPRGAIEVTTKEAR